MPALFVTGRSQSWIKILDQDQERFALTRELLSLSAKVTKDRCAGVADAIEPHRYPALLAGEGPA
ncbi:MAG TPA: hypothetical protein VK753_08530, partial [Xanthomonadaceae bacterium]|nr:hypothetical protein [Xanthomonadaceae bacterium]